MNLIDMMDSVDDHNFASEEEENGEVEDDDNLDDEASGKDCGNSPEGPVVHPVGPGLGESNCGGRGDSCRYYLHDHNYASAKTLSVAMESSPDAVGEGGCENGNCKDNCMEIPLKWTEEEVKDGAEEEELCNFLSPHKIVSVAVATQTTNSQKDEVELTDVVTELQKANDAKVAAAEREIERLTRLLDDEQRNKKTEGEKGFAKIQSSVANVCCGLTVFIEEFRKKFNAWCVSGGVEEQEKIRFQTEIDSVADLIQKKLQAWLADGLIEQVEWSTTQETVTETDPERNVKTTQPQEGLKISVEVNSIPPDVVTTNSAGSPKDTDYVLDSTSTCCLSNTSVDQKQENENAKTAISKVNEPIGKVQHAEASINGAFICTCGVICKSKSGLKCHIRQLSRGVKNLTRQRKQITPPRKVCEPIVTNNDSHSSSQVVTPVKDSDNVDVFAGPSARSPEKTTPIKLKDPEMMKLVNSTSPRVLLTRMSTVGLAFKGATMPLLSPKMEELCSSAPTSPVEEFALDESFKSIKEEKMEKVANDPKLPKPVHAVDLKTPLKCTCGMTFVVNYLLKKHIHYYLLERKFLCTYCPRRFHYARHVVQHCRSVHKIRLAISSVATTAEQGAQSDNATPEISPVIKIKQEEGVPGTPNGLNFIRFFSKKRRHTSKRKRKLLRITAKERIHCPCCRRRFPHLRDLARHMARRIHGGEGIQSRGLNGQKRRKSSTGSSIPGSSTITASIAEATASNINLGCSRTPATPFRRSTRSQKIEPDINLNVPKKLNLNEDSISSGSSSGVKEVSRLKTREVKGQRCICDRRCDKIKNRKGSSPPHCTICEKRFGCLELLQNHFLQQHNIRCEVPKVCNVCFITFDTKAELVDHLNTHQSSSKSSLSETPKPPEKSIPVVAVQQPKSLSSTKGRGKVPRVQQKRHYWIKGRGLLSYKCSCGTTYGKLKPLQKHIQVKTRGKIFTCKYCKGGFTTNSNLLKHLRNIHGVDSKMFGCGLCGKTFNTNINRISHQRKTHANDAYKRQVPARKKK